MRRVVPALRDLTQCYGLAGINSRADAQGTAVDAFRAVHFGYWGVGVGATAWLSRIRRFGRCSDHHRHITAQELSDPPVAIVMEGDPALVEGEIKGWRLSGRFARCDIGYRPILFSRCAEVVLGDRK